MHRPLRILIIDDSPDERALTLRALGRELGDIAVDHATEQRDLDRVLASRDYDLVITDYRLCWSDGLTVLRAIKARDADCPVIMFTGTGDEDIAVEAMKAGLDDYVVKTPHHCARLPVAARLALDRCAQRRSARMAERRFRDLFERVPIGLYRITPEGGILDANPALAQIAGFPERAALLACNAVDFFMSAESFRRWRERVEVQETVRNFEGSVRRLDGGVIWVRHSARAVRDADGRTRYYEGAVEDITEARRAAEALRASEAHLRAVVDAEPECVKLLGPDGLVRQMNAAGLALLEADGPEQVIGKPVMDLIAPEHRETFRAFNESVLRGNRGSLEFEIVSLKGTRRWLETHAVPLRDEKGETLHLGITRDIGERKRAEERLNYLAHYDSVTGLPNRTLLADRMQQAMIEAQRHERLVGIVFLDLDRFKNINDSLGHEVGDQLLRAVAERLTGAVRKGDTVARLSGDEFTLVLADMAHVDDAVRVAQKILDVFMQPFRIAGRELFFTASMGITLYPFDEQEVEGLLRNADVAMYRAKELGRNSYHFYTAEMTVKAEESLALENEMRRALKRKEFSLHYQPVVDLRSGRIAGMEALLRWNHGERGPISPAQFIPLAEETGLIVPVGEWVLRAACAQAKGWHDAGFRELRLAVNISARQFQDKNFAFVVARILEETGLDPRALDLEITESVIMQQAEASVATLREFSARGVSFSIDDFGTGYSSLSYLKRFPIDFLKIDRSFVRDITTDTDDATLVATMITMAHGLGIKAVAEGVETQAQLAFLDEHRCDAIQGYYFSRPVPAEEFASLLRAKKSLGRAKPVKELL